jgi:large subunit ribosomal protein L37
MLRKTVIICYINSLCSFSIVGSQDKPLPLDENHPSYHERSAFMYGENSVLVEGLPQAQNLTNTVILKQGLPDKIEEMAEENQKLLPQDVDERVKRFVYSIVHKIDFINASYLFYFSCIMRSQILDAVQEKLPKRKDPERPHWNYPRDFGVPDYRRKYDLFFLLFSSSI